jgi:hypothetical protein
MLPRENEARSQSFRRRRCCPYCPLLILTAPRPPLSSVLVTEATTSTPRLVLRFWRSMRKLPADAFCGLNGQGPAIRWERAPNPGFSTMIISNDQVCVPSGHGCDSFVFIECQGNQTPSATQTFVDPTYNGYRLDWCLIFENECGVPAANAFCKKQGYNGVNTFGFQAGPGLATMTVGQNSVCDPQWHRCDSFASITCN